MTIGKEHLHHLRYRVAKQPSPGVPMGVRSCGHYRVESGWRELSQSKPFSEIFCCQDGCGQFSLGERSLVVHPGECFVYRAGQFHDILALDGVWEYRWWTLDGPLAEALLDQFGLGAGVHRGGIDARRFDELDAALAEPGPAAERRASAIAYDCCSRLAPGVEEAGDAMVLQALQLIHEHWADDSYGINQLAAELGQHRSRLSRRFKAAMGLSPMAYLGHLRIQRACAQLRSSDASIAHVAADCGYADPDYFARVFRKETGQTPSHFRRHGPQ